MAELQVDVRSSRIESARVYDPFDEALETLIENNYEIISTAQNAQLRIQQGAKSSVSQNGNWVKEGIIYVPKSGSSLVRISPILAQAKDATRAHGDGREFYLTSSQEEEILVDSVAFPKNNIEIPTNKFGSEKLTVYVFGGEREAEQYGAFLRDAGIKTMPVWAVNSKNVNSQSQTFVRQLWFSRLDSYWSSLNGSNRNLFHGNTVRGITLDAWSNL